MFHVSISLPHKDEAEETDVRMKARKVNTRYFLFII